jgi:hypothetical protein
VINPLKQPDLRRPSPFPSPIHILPTPTNPLPTNKSFFGALGCAFSIVFTVIGASYGTAKSAGAIFSSGVIRPDRMMQNTYGLAPFLLVFQFRLPCIAPPQY